MKKIAAILLHLSVCIDSDLLGKGKKCLFAFGKTSRPLFSSFFPSSSAISANVFLFSLSLCFFHSISLAFLLNVYLSLLYLSNTHLTLSSLTFSCDLTLFHLYFSYFFSLFLCMPLVYCSQFFYLFYTYFPFFLLSRMSQTLNGFFMHQ